MIVTIQFDTTSAPDETALKRLFGGGDVTVNQTFPTQSERQTAAKKAAPEPEPEPDADEPAPAKKTAAKRAPAKKAAAKKAEPEPEDDVDPLDVAIERATEMVQSGGIKTVKAALAAVGAKKVSDLTGNKVEAFLEALDEAAAA